jgi:hypothetical protein
MKLVWREKIENMRRIKEDDERIRDICLAGSHSLSQLSESNQRVKLYQVKFLTRQNENFKEKQDFIRI